MIFVLFSVLLFGFVHPGSKIILENGIPLSFFCIFFIGFRVIFLLPVLALKKQDLSLSKKHIFYLILFGLIGASLQYFEFKGIDEGLSPGLVTFLVFSYPLWIYLFNLFKGTSNNSLYKLLQLSLIISGVYLIAGSSLAGAELKLLVYPLLASISIAGWILLSSFLRKEGLTPLTLSFYYDLFSLIILLILFGGNIVGGLPTLGGWMTTENMGQMFAYAALIGLLPNLFFYYGAPKITSDLSAGLLAFEPVVSSIYSWIFLGVVLGETFWFGAVLVILGNLPQKLVPLNRIRPF